VVEDVELTRWPSTGAIYAPVARYFADPVGMLAGHD
jgi:hypothetical protein